MSDDTLVRVQVENVRIRWKLWTSRLRQLHWSSCRKGYSKEAISYQELSPPLSVLVAITAHSLTTSYVDEDD